ncbi:small ribosomal subunit protein mS31-like [Diabrotica undecimpunctata]|uniref:small ribosomal subunit protein mS31-like n=1 Tax=Diabrotica undecimpunctata TaxID=50387 RepID=UPI003B6424B0
MRKPQQQFKPKQEMVVQKIDLFGSKPLGIFNNKDMQENETNTWQKLYERDLKLATTHPTSNYFQQMILWTEQGKLWKFPIDNEQDLEEEKKVDFSKHIFLEEHLEPWCPQKGPIRYFMELVYVGLSKNLYLTVEAKIEHIYWYKYIHIGFVF